MRFIRIAGVITVLGWLCVAAVLPVLGVPIVSVNPVSQIVQSGEDFTLAIDIANAVDVYAFQFDLVFDPNILTAADIVEGAFLSSGGGMTFFLPGMIDNQAGTITFTIGTLQGPVAGVTGGGTLATVRLHALAEGQSVLQLDNVLLFDAQPLPVEIAADTTPGTVEVQSVPEPATLLLLTTGLLGLLGLRPQRWSYWCCLVVGRRNR